MSHSRSDKSCNEECKVRCGADVAAALIGRPKVRCHEKWRKNTDFDVEVEIDINPRCKITPKRHFQRDQGKCKHRCLLNVELDFDCNARAICTPCGRPEAEFRLDIEVPVKTKCDIKRHGRCGDDSKRKDWSKDWSNGSRKECDKSHSKKKCDESHSKKKCDRSRRHRSHKKSNCSRKRYWY